jgi:hypothetical protein
MESVTRLVFCTGKVYYDLLARKEELNARNVALVRIEQLHPFPQKGREQNFREIQACYVETYGFRKSLRIWGPGHISEACCPMSIWYL